MKFIANFIKKNFYKIKRKFLKHSYIYDKLIGQILKDKGIITENQLQEALTVQKETLYNAGRLVRLGQVIVNLGYASEEKIVKTINESYKINVTSLKDNIKELITEKRGTFYEKLPNPGLPIWMQLSIAATFLIILIIFLSSYTNLSRQKKSLYMQTVKIGKISLNYFVNNSSVPLLENNILRLNTLIKEASDVEGIFYALILNNDKIIMAHTDLNKIGSALENNYVKSNVKHEKKVTYFNCTLPTGEKILNLIQPVVFKGKELGEVHVGVSIDFIERAIKKDRDLIIIKALFIIAVGIGIAILIGLWFSNPFSELLIAIQEIGKGNYKHKVKINRKDEFGTLGLAFNKMSDELNMNALMKESFGKYIGSDILQMIISNPESEWLKGVKNEATIIFTDVRGFTAYAETKEPEEVVENLNEYFEIATNTILYFGGYVDKFIGDAVLGVFGIPVFQKDHAKRAMMATIALQKRFESNKKNSLLSKIGIGVNSGIVVSGNIGSQQKMEYTVIGDSVNVASRLSSLAGPGEVIISKTVYDHLRDEIKVEALGPKKIKGKAEPVETFKIIRMEEN